MAASESKFRETESMLDEVVHRAVPILNSLGISAKDASVRRYGRGQYLCWSYEFTKSWELELETAQVRLILTFNEPIEDTQPVEIAVWRCAEKFRSAQISSIREVHERNILPTNFETWKIEDLIIREIEDGTRFLRK